MRSVQDEDRLLQLLSQSWDCGLTEENRAEIDALASKLGDEGARLILDASFMHVELGRIAAASAVHHKAMERIRPTRSKTPVQRMENSRRVVAVAACFALVASICFVWFAIPKKNLQDFGDLNARLSPVQQQTLRPPPLIAFVRSMENAVWNVGAEAKLGQSLSVGERLELQAGSVVLDMVHGAELYMTGPCALSLNAQDHVTLDYGKIVTRYADWGDEFVIEASGLQVVNKGQQFAVTAGRDGTVEAHAIEGHIRAEPTSIENVAAQDSIMLASGQAIRVDRATSRMDVIEARPWEFVGTSNPFRPLQPIPIWNTGINQEIGAQDAHWRIVDGSQEFGPYPKNAIVSDGFIRTYKSNEPEHSQWISLRPDIGHGVSSDCLFTFETEFDLTGFDLSTVHIAGNFLVDNTLRELRINGERVSFEPWISTHDEFNFRRFHPVEIKSGFVPGKNVITAVVYNLTCHPGCAEHFNPMGLRVEWQAYGSREQETAQVNETEPTSP